MTIISAAVGLLLIAGCATTFKPWKLSDVREGMDKSEVIGILGAPDSSETKDGAEYLYYTYREELAPRASVSLETAEGVDRRVDELNRTIKEYKYSVILVEGRVVSYKELRK